MVYSCNGIFLISVAGSTGRGGRDLGAPPGEGEEGEGGGVSEEAGEGEPATGSSSLPTLGTREATCRSTLQNQLA